MTSSSSLIAAILLLAGACGPPPAPIDPTIVAGRVYGDQLRQARAQLDRQEWLAARARLTDVRTAVPAQDPIGAEARALLARVAFELGEYVEAERVAAEVPASSSFSAAARETRAQSLMFACRFGDAEGVLFELATEDEPRARAWLGMLYAWKGADGNALRELEAVLERAPASEHASNAHFYSAQLAFWGGRSDEASAELDRLGPYLPELRGRADNWAARGTHLLRAYFSYDTLSRWAMHRGRPELSDYDRAADGVLQALVRAPGACAPHVPRLVEARQELMRLRHEEDERRRGLADAERREHERLTHDTDADGLPDVRDRCPNEAETYNAIDDDDGCPEATAAIAVRGNQIVIREGHALHFATNSADVLEQSQPVLDAIARVLLDPQYDYIRRVRIEGHTDDLGDPERNLRLSELRANSVGAALVARGISQTRLTRAWFGSMRPIDLRGTDDARGRNRRVELHITDPASIGGAGRRSY